MIDGFAITDWGKSKRVAFNGNTGGFNGTIMGKHGKKHMNIVKHDQHYTHIHTHTHTGQILYEYIYIYMGLIGF